MKLVFCLIFFHFLDLVNCKNSINSTILTTFSIIENDFDNALNNSSTFNQTSSLKNDTNLSTKNSFELVKIINNFKKVLEAISVKFIKLYEIYLRHLNQVWNNLYVNNKSKISLVLANFSALVFTLLGILLYNFPELKKNQLWFTDKAQIGKIGQFGQKLEEIATSINKAIDIYSNIEPDICVKIALCALGSSKLYNLKYRSKTLDSINIILALPGLSEFVVKNSEYRDSHSFGIGGGNCELINIKKKCPLNFESWILLLSSLSSVI